MDQAKLLGVIVKKRKALVKNAQKYSLWGAIIMIALVLLPAGAAKLAGVPQMHASFAALGLPNWFGYFIGTCEIAGAIGLFVASLSALAALGISVIMLGAIYFHATHTPLVQAVLAALVLVLCIYVIYRRRSPTGSRIEA